MPPYLLWDYYTDKTIRIPHKIQTKNRVCLLCGHEFPQKNSVEVLSTESDLPSLKKSENDLVLDHWYPEFHLIVW